MLKSKGYNKPKQKTSVEEIITYKIGITCRQRIIVILILYTNYKTFFFPAFKCCIVVSLFFKSVVLYIRDECLHNCDCWILIILMLTNYMGLDFSHNYFLVKKLGLTANLFRKCLYSVRNKILFTVVSLVHIVERLLVSVFYGLRFEFTLDFGIIFS